jgi:hypothetical protein
MEEELYDAVLLGTEEEVRIILEENKYRINVNWKSPLGWAPLHCAVANGHDKITSMLLAHPSIDVNQNSQHGSTPFFLACENGMTACAQLLLRDVRVEVNKRNQHGCTPLRFAARYGHLGVIRCWIASGREMDLGWPGYDNSDAIGVAMSWGKTLVVTLLEKFEENPTQTRHEVRLELGCLEAMAAELFSMVIFLCDELVEIKEENTTTEAGGFFGIAKRLPIELQMVLCCRVVGFNGDNIPVEQREAAFKKLAKGLLSN